MVTVSKRKPEGYYIALLSLHGLLRGHSLELGRDADTGGQILYVAELARALARHPDVARVDLMTRQVMDSRIDADYAEQEEEICSGCSIIRIPFGPRRYLRKEVLWNHLDAFVDNSLQHFRRIGRIPDLLHSHYADAGYAGSRLSQLLGVPLIHTGHSLGRVKKQHLQENGVADEVIEQRYNIERRIEAEEITLGNAALVIASTSQEVRQQYRQYENYHPKRYTVIPPGVDIERFRPPRRGDQQPDIADEIQRFLREPRKPMILAMSRPDERKNISTLVHAFGGNRQLRESANLVIIAGNRDDITEMDRGAQAVLSEILLLIDSYDLYGSVAIPKHHRATDVPDVYRMAARSKGVFINPALTEPFGLTLIEAAASGLPIIATNDGGPKEIVAHCQNGILINPHKVKAMSNALLKAIQQRDQWQRWSRNGIRGAKRHYTWKGHVTNYLKQVRNVIGAQKQSGISSMAKTRLISVDRILVCDIDNTLLGNKAAIKRLLALLNNSDKTGFGIATGRNIKSTLKVLNEWGIPRPDFLISAVGSEIHYGNSMINDDGWSKHISYQWQPDDIRNAMRGLPGIKLQAASEQLEFKISFNVDEKKMPPLSKIRKHLRSHDLHTKLIYSHQAYLDILPIRASKGLAIRYLGMKWIMEAENMLVAGDSGNDEEMLSGNTLGVVVGNYSPELECLRGRPRIYFAKSDNADGIIEGINHYDFLGKIRIPDEA